jgi:hypothetical protein
LPVRKRLADAIAEISSQGATPVKGEQADAVEEKLTFQEAIEHLINKYSQDNGSDTPDFILAKFLYDTLENFNHAVTWREQWYSRPKV